METFAGQGNLVQCLDFNAFKAGDPVTAIENTIKPFHALGTDLAKWFDAAQSSNRSRSECIQQLRRRYTDMCERTWAHLQTCAQNHFMEGFAAGLRLAIEALRNNGEVHADEGSSQVSFINMQMIHFGADSAHFPRTNGARRPLVRSARHLVMLASRVSSGV